MQILLILFKSYFSFLSISILAFILGFILRRIFKYSSEISFKNIFFSFLVGLFVLIFLFSTYYTNFKTVFVLLLLFVFPFAIVRPKIEKTSSFTPRNTVFIYLAGLHLICFLLCFPIIFNFAGQIRNVYIDYHFHIRIIDFLKITGQENEYHGLNLLNKSFHGPRPYHFADIWSVLLSDKLTGLGVLKSVFLIVSPFYIFLTLIGVIAYFEENIQENFFLKIILIVFVSLNCGGVFLYFYQNFNFIADYKLFNLSLLLFSPSLRDLILYPLLVAFLLIKPLSQKFSIMALIAISSFTLLPAVLGAIILEFLFLIIKYRNLERAKKLLFPIFTCLSILIFYQIFKNESGITRQGLGINAVLEQITLILTDYNSFFGAIKNFIATLLRHGIFFWVFFAYWLVFKPKVLTFFVKNTNGRAMFFILLAGTFTLAIFRTILNSTQLIYNISMPFWGILIAILMIDTLLEFIDKRKIIALSIGLLLFLPTLLSKISSFPNTALMMENRDVQYINNVSKWVREQKAEIIMGGSLKNSQIDYSSSYDKYVTIYTLGYELSEFIEKPFLTVSLNDLSIPISEDILIQKQDIAAINQGAFYNFAKKKKDTNQSLSEASLMLDFIKENKLQFIITRKGVILPKEIKAIVKKMFLDKKTGEQFIILKNE